ncbi:hypothetical protein HELRODRAFT_114296 [Helobdella robusta]|uniref:Sugar phosphate transporter domain-containing protein n=1 Tax=Helobdella robusta TaxID=6412 RepID=T1EG06_HELRO|nr:hypothetical protein HELRODRAFT_114296 [Helobdella robusta]ESN97220.1 hypothetical protein HELRODRAFT_114296 [Helobdella robusta]
MFAILFHTKYREVLKIICLCLFWYMVSSAMGVVGKLVLSDFPYPMTVTMVQLLSISVYLIPVMKSFVKTSWIPYHIPLKYWLQIILPLSFGKFVSSVSSHISIWKVPVSYAHTVKATMPFFTVILSRIILKEKQSKKIYLSLVPIISGVVIASLTELSFDMLGLISALVSTIGFALQNIFSKKCLKEVGLHEFSLLFTLAIIAGCMFLPVWVFYDLSRIIEDTSLSHSMHLPRLIALLVIDGFCNFAQNVIAFSIIALVTPLSYAVANCTKRIAVISVSLLVLGNPVTAVNVVGMMTAIFGVLLYNKAKYDQHREKKHLPVLPSYEIKSSHNINSIISDSISNGYIGHYNKNNMEIIASTDNSKLLVV